MGVKQDTAFFTPTGTHAEQAAAFAAIPMVDPRSFAGTGVAA
ncbi:hypothetical protein [Cryobacterium sp. SO1]|nr:hypothetical protein [Cryobacterium sp. SO1]RZI36978.1 hypothetical protein BJQ95_00645 [Cryobacterium sp. SO1]